MNWEEMSDYQINLKVLGKQFGQLGDDKDMVRIWEQGKFQPCNSWADAGPIIEKYKIDLKFGDDVDETLKGCCMAYSGTHSATHDNPLRAAMIVFLMMQEPA